MRRWQWERPVPTVPEGTLCQPVGLRNGSFTSSQACSPLGCRTLYPPCILDSMHTKPEAQSGAPLRGALAGGARKLGMCLCTQRLPSVFDRKWDPVLVTVLLL